MTAAGGGVLPESRPTGCKTPAGLVDNYAALALTVARMLPVTAALIGTDLTRRDRLFLGWARPRGIGSVVFGLLAYIELAGPEAEVVLAVMVVTVAASIVVHG